MRRSKIEWALPDDGDGSPGTRRITAELSNINVNKAPAPRLLLGGSATGELWEVESHTLLERQSGMVTEVSCGPDCLTLTIEENGVAPLQALIPKRLVREFFPSADFSGVSGAGDPCVIIPWGTLYKVPLPLCQRPYLHAEFTRWVPSIASPTSPLMGIPPYPVQPGDMLQYDILWPFPGQYVALDVSTGDGRALRNLGAVDQNGIASDPHTNLDSVAVNRWYKREISLQNLVGYTLSLYAIACEANDAGGHVGFISNARIVNSQGELQLTIFN